MMRWLVAIITHKLTHTIRSSNEEWLIFVFSFSYLFYFCGKNAWVEPIKISGWYAIKRGHKFVIIKHSVLATSHVSY